MARPGNSSTVSGVSLGSTARAKDPTREVAMRQLEGALRLYAEHGGNLLTRENSLACANDLDVVLTALNTARATPAWLPIESAPMGKTVLIGSSELEGTVGVVTARRTKDGWQSDEVNFEPWEEPDYENDDEETMVTINPSPTHWMPLPSPPVQS